MARILYVEDEAWQVQSTVITFIEKELEHTVILVESIAAAIEELSTTAYDAIFLDIMLNAKGVIEFENSGLLIVQLILDGEFAAAGNLPSTPIVIVSGVWDATIKDSIGTRWTVEDRAHNLGISHQYFLRKPFLVDEVSKVLDRALQESAEK
jgi:CheY-like chemotaxis protein